MGPHFAGEIVVCLFTLPFVLLVSAGLSCLLFMGAKEIRRLGFVEGLPNLCGFVFLWTVIETACGIALSAMLQNEEGHAKTMPIIQWLSGILCIASIVIGLGWIAGKRIVMRASDWMMSGAFVDME
jgi:hypothetical protein